MDKPFVCTCGYEAFHAGTNGELFMCSKCYKIYDKTGKEIEPKQDTDAKTIKII